MGYGHAEGINNSTSDRDKAQQKADQQWNKHVDKEINKLFGSDKSNEGGKKK